MNLVAIGRFVAAGLSSSTFLFLFLHDSWHAGNLFLVPDLILCAALAVGAALPARYARAVLPIAFGYAAGVLATSVASYAVRGEFGLPSMLGAVLAAVVGALLIQSSEPVRARQATGRGSS